mgnify:CR=1 FL=1
MSIIELLSEGESLRETIVEVAQPVDTIRSFKIYHSTDESRYEVWLLKCQEYLARHTTPDFSRGFSSFASKDITPSNHEKMLRYLTAANQINDEKTELDKIREAEEAYKSGSEQFGSNPAILKRLFVEWHSKTVIYLYRLLGDGNEDYQRIKNIDVNQSAEELNKWFWSINSDYNLLLIKASSMESNRIITPAIIKEEHDEASPKEEPTKSEIFISYSHKDTKYKDLLVPHLKVYAQQNNANFWDDTMIGHGEWKKQIEEALKRSNIAIFLVSDNFLSSDFIINNELPTILTKAVGEGTKVVVIIVRPCMFYKSVLSTYQAENPPEQPLSSMSENDIDQLFVKMLSGL